MLTTTLLVFLLPGVTASTISSFHNHMPILAPNLKFEVMAATRTESSMSDRFPPFFLIILVIWSSSPSFKTTNSLRSQSSETWSLEVQRVRLTKVLKNHASPNTPITTWYKHGFEYLFLPPRDLTQCMDVSPNPGPTFAHVLASKRACSYATHVPVQGMQFTKPNPSI